jgi:hypothetical protein
MRKLLILAIFAALVWILAAAWPVRRPVRLTPEERRESITNPKGKG